MNQGVRGVKGSPPGAVARSRVESSGYSRHAFRGALALPLGENTQKWGQIVKSRIARIGGDHVITHLGNQRSSRSVRLATAHG